MNVIRHENPGQEANLLTSPERFKFFNNDVAGGSPIEIWITLKTGEGYESGGAEIVEVLEAWHGSWFARHRGGVNHLSHHKWWATRDSHFPP